jgi:hypothetical protein
VARRRTTESAETPRVAGRSCALGRRRSQPTDQPNDQLRHALDGPLEHALRGHVHQPLLVGKLCGVGR